MFKAHLCALLAAQVFVAQAFAADDFIKKTNPGDVQWCPSPAGKQWIKNQWNAQADEQIKAVWARQPYVGGQIPAPVATEMGQKIANVEQSAAGYIPCEGSPGACSPNLSTHACHATVKLVNESHITGTFYEFSAGGLPPIAEFEADSARKAAGY